MDLRNRHGPALPKSGSGFGDRPESREAIVWKPGIYSGHAGGSVLRESQAGGSAGDRKESYSTRAEECGLASTASQVSNRGIVAGDFGAARTSVAAVFSPLLLDAALPLVP